MLIDERKLIEIKEKIMNGEALTKEQQMIVLVLISEQLKRGDK